MLTYHPQPKKLGDYWKSTIKEVLNHGRTVNHKGTLLKELPNISLLLQPGDFEKDFKEVEKFHDKELIEWMDKLWSDPEFKTDFGYSYAKRIYNYKGKNQVKKVVELLTYIPTSKSALITLANPEEDDPRIPASPPCISLLDFKLYEGTIFLNVFFRSWDVGKKFCLDLLNLYKIYKRAADELKAAMGSINCFVSSAHVYKDDLEKIRLLLEEEGGWF